MKYVVKAKRDLGYGVYDTIIIETFDNLAMAEWFIEETNYWIEEVLL